MISACLLGENCKYNGGSNLKEDLVSALKGHTLIPVCPERAGGLATPRLPSERVKDRVVNRAGEDVTEAFKKGAEETLRAALEKKPDLVILKAKSPSCGLGQVYDGTFSGRLIPGNGLTADLLLKNGFRVVTDEWEGLADFLNAE